MGRPHSPEYIRDYWKRNPKKYLVAAAKSRARIQSIDFNITEDDFEIPKYCPILGIELGEVRNTPQNKDYSPSLDRIDNTKGYVRNNICVISAKANRHKSDMTLKQIKALYDYVRLIELTDEERSLYISGESAGHKDYW